MNQIKKIPVDCIDLCNANCRNIDDKHVEALVKSIREGTLIPNITCRPSPDWDNRYEVVDGQHRVEAYKRLVEKNKQLAEKYTHIDAIVKEMDDYEAFCQSERGNMGKPLTRTEKDRAAYIHYVNGNDIKTVCVKMGITAKPVEESIIRHVCLVRDTKLAFDSKLINIHGANLLARLKHKDQNILYSEFLQPKVKANRDKDQHFENYVFNNPESEHNVTIKNLKFFIQNKKMPFTIIDIHEKNIQKLDQNTQNGCEVYEEDTQVVSDTPETYETQFNNNVQNQKDHVSNNKKQINETTSPSLNDKVQKGKPKAKKSSTRNKSRRLQKELTISVKLELTIEQLELLYSCVPAEMEKLQNVRHTLNQSLTENNCVT
jgi:hypothetical protein